MKTIFFSSLLTLTLTLPSWEGASDHERNHALDRAAQLFPVTEIQTGPVIDPDVPMPGVEVPYVPPKAIYPDNPITHSELLGRVRQLEVRVAQLNRRIRRHHGR